MAETQIARPYGKRLNQPGMSVAKFVDYSGGLNKRDAPSELQENESPDCMNFTLDERGGLVKRLGYEVVGVLGDIPVRSFFFWHKTGQMFAQHGIQIAVSTD